MARTDGRMAVCPVDPMNDAPMISAMHIDCALPLTVRGCHPIISHPNNRATEQRNILIGSPLMTEHGDMPMVGWHYARLIRWLMLR